MLKVRSLLAIVAMLAMVSCVNDTVDDHRTESTDMSVAHKYVNSSEGAYGGSLLINVDEATAEALTQGRKSALTGIAAFDGIAAEVEGLRVRPAINMTKNTERKRRYGFHRWFVVEFDQTADIDAVAAQFAAIDEVRGVEFTTPLAMPKPQAVVVESPLAEATRAVGQKFNDPMYPMQWHYHNTGNKAIYPTAVAGMDINLEAAWAITSGNSNVVVAIVDEGVDYNHPDLKDNMWVNAAEQSGQAGVDDDGNGYVDDIYGYNFVPGTEGVISWDRDTDKENGDSGHGTHVAGTVAAVNNNSIGVSGVAGGNGRGNGVRLMSCQIMSGVLPSTTTTTPDAVVYAADNGACILQNSWGYKLNSAGAYPMNSDSEYERASSLLLHSIAYFMETKNCEALDGGIVIFAASNDTQPRASYPAAYRDYIAVAAIGPDGMPAVYTNYGPGVNVSAPGGNIDPDFSTNAGQVMSTLPDGKYGYMQGTSMACPHVSGVAALVLSHALEQGKTLTLDELKTILTTSVNEIDSRLNGSIPTWNGSMNLATYKGQMGTGVIDAYRALMASRGTTCVSAVVGQEVTIDPNTLLGDGQLSMKLLKSVDVAEDVKARLGIQGVSVFGNKVYLTCEKPGSGTITVHAIAGGDAVGGGSSIGGMSIAIEVAIISREVNDTQGWL